MALYFSGILLFFLLSLFVGWSKQTTIYDNRTSDAEDLAIRLINQFPKELNNSIYRIYHNNQVIFVTITKIVIEPKIYFSVSDDGNLFNNTVEGSDFKTIKCGYEYIEKNENVTNVIHKLEEHWNKIWALPLDNLLYYRQMDQEIRECSNAMESNKTKGIISLLSWNDFSGIKSGIFPGTKWCGPGNIARNYYDLGRHEKTDSCCRSHDLCPFSISRKSESFNLNNWNDFTISHCNCDIDFYYCLKDADTTTSKIVGSIYFGYLSKCIGYNNHFWDSYGNSAKLKIEQITLPWNTNVSLSNLRFEKIINSLSVSDGRTWIGTSLNLSETGLMNLQKKIVKPYILGSTKPEK